ncbi:MAG: DUF2794 domain-containing protein [Pseudomonadota bacterium]
MTRRIEFAGHQSKPVERTVFHRRELNRILSVYGHLVGSGAARDYAIAMLTDRAVFSIYRRAAERPTWTIEKVPALARRQGAWAVRGAEGQILKRGHDLGPVLKVFERHKLKIVT